MEKNAEGFKDDSYAFCPECGNDYELQIIGNDYHGIEYLCACCYNEFTVKKSTGYDNAKR